jgi:protein disulfide-isomerase
MEEAEDRGDERALRAARNTRVVLEDRKEVQFAWVDSVFWERWIRTTFGIDVAKGERVVIVDQDVSLHSTYLPYFSILTII